MKVFIDTSFFIEYFLGNEKAKNIYDRIKLEDLYTSLDVVKETAYIIIMKFTASDILGVEKHYEILKGLKENEEVYNASFNRARDFYQTIVDEGIKILMSAPWEITFEIMKQYKLLPNDAAIAATCKYYGIRKIATFDDDFKKVDFLEIVEI